MTTSISTLSPRVTEVLGIAERFSSGERLVLAKLLLDSIVVRESDDETEWQHLGLAAFEKDWDNPDDAVYDDWRALYDTPAR
jgi:hypothetical protein